jgi:DNA-binding CsgD family transcriptional regulator
MNDYLMHYGVGWDDNPPGRGSGRYPHGSGENPNQHETGLRHDVKILKNAGWSETEIAEKYGWKTQELRDRIHIEKVEARNLKHEQAVKLFNEGKSYSEIARIMNTNDNSVRLLLDPYKHENNNRSLNTAKMLKKEIDEHGMTDIGNGMAARLGITETMLNNSIRFLDIEGYHVYEIPISQNGTNKKTTMKVLAPKDMTWSDCVKNKDKVNIVNDPYTEDGGRTWENIEPPIPISAKRIYVKYAEDGGKDRDGLIEIRRGVPDLNIGNHNYAQVRIGVSKKDDITSYEDGTNYMKGVAIYSDEVPKGYDVVYNSNKPKGSDFNDVFKKYKKDKDGNITWDNPFGANIKANKFDDAGNVVREVGQKHYIDKDGNKKLSSINIVNEAGDWADWTARLSSQFLSKQRNELAKEQLELSYSSKRRELNDILALENPEIKMKLLDSFADDCDAASIHLKAAPLPRQQSHVIIPINSLKDYECYAPNYKDGTVVSLVRHPHGGIFEIPTLIVNNQNAEGRKFIGLDAPDAIGINGAVANQLSGADFDGDTVIVLPNKNKNVIKSQPGLDGLKDFDTKIFKKPKDAIPTGPKKMEDGSVGDGFNKQREMGRITNLITDMTLHAASTEEITRADKYSMVVIDAEKHNLDWRKAEKEFDIAGLRKLYQSEGGAGTLISRSKNQATTLEKASFTPSMIDKDTGTINWRYTNRFIKEFVPETKTYRAPDDKFFSELTQELENKGIHVKGTSKYRIYTDRDDEETAQIISDFATKFKKENGYTYKMATQRSTKMAETNNAYSLSSGTKMEAIYAEYANSMKSMANEARKIRVNLDATKYDPDAASKYKNEVASINTKINKAMQHKPLERKVQAMADVKLYELKMDHPEYDKQTLKKHRAKMVTEIRQRMGTQKERPVLTTDEWNAVQAGAMHSTKINQLFSLMDVDTVREYATPKNYQSKLTKGEIAYAKSLMNSKIYTQAQIAEFLNVSVSTLRNAIKEE